MGGHAQAKMSPETDINRHLLRQAMENARVSLVLHGHWHQYHDDTTYDGVRVVGLACNTSRWWTTAGPNMAILETEDLSITPVKQEK